MAQENGHRDALAVVTMAGRAPGGGALVGYRQKRSSGARKRRPSAPNPSPTAKGRTGCIGCAGRKLKGKAGFGVSAMGLVCQFVLTKTPLAERVAPIAFVCLMVVSS